MKPQKAIFLSLALLLPVAIFIFLKFFGRNEFDVPAFYQDEKPETPHGCSYSYVTPYTVPDTVMTILRYDGVKRLYLVYYSDAAALSRVSELHYDNELILVNGADNTLAAARRCTLLVKDSQNVVLIDNDKKIRGYYLASDREEIDRLMMEIDIILKKY